MSDEVPPETEGADAPAEADAAADGEAKPDEGAEAPAEGEEGEKKEGEEGAEGAADGEKKEPPDTGVGDRIKKDPHELDFLVPLPEKIEFH